MSFHTIAQARVRLHRSELAVPAIQPRFFDKAAASAADVVFLDLEDAVAPDDKEQARKNAIGALNDIDWGDKTMAVRINGLDTHYMYRDVIDLMEQAGLFGTLVHGWFPESTASSGAYALVTMGAVVAAATHAPITAITMIFELTQSINIIPPLMAACVVSTLVTTFLQRDSIYTMKLRRRGIDLFKEQNANVLKNLYVHDIIDREPETLTASANLETVIDRALTSDHTEFFVLNGRNELIGAIYLRQLTRMLVEQEFLGSLVIASDLLEPGLPTVTENEDLDLVMQLFSHGTAEEIAVVDGQNAKTLVGSVHKHDVIHAYNQEILRRDLAGTVSSNVMVASKGQQVQLGGGYVLQEIQPPMRYFGQTIRELNIAAETGVHVILHRRRTVDDGGPALRALLRRD